ncbi:hypothetical protein RFI_21968 [Reticulomyxa filosa]|uniref:Poly(A) RNA polymerase mitochondrial-like central palm domain-containing protein n=1 Tax=Reticulomyxa filosa TaxID=46433 RepID=X6MN54_RETFI|nr:hypothetical protein RFI_21968 [Reticulomyxa filosa]|eukprot:ETO15398.1 hypothetical protein RFI_21968 [Reticulomyxa filosa]
MEDTSNIISQEKIWKDFSERLWEHYEHHTPKDPYLLAQKHFEEVLKQSVHQALKKINLKPSALVIFGSTAWGISTIGSDLDIGILLPELDPNSQNNKQRIRRVIQELKFQLTPISAVLFARVPIIRCVYRSDTRFEADISVTTPLVSVTNAYMKKYMNSHPLVKPFVIAVKHWAKSCKLVDAYCGYFNSFGITILALKLLQKYKIIPVYPLSIVYKQQDKEETQDITKQTQSQYQLGGLLYAFFRFILEFDWKKNHIQITSAGLFFLIFFANSNDFDV